MPVILSAQMSSGAVGADVGAEVGAIVGAVVGVVVGYLNEEEDGKLGNA